MILQSLVQICCRVLYIDLKISDDEIGPDEVEGDPYADEQVDENYDLEDTGKFFSEAPIPASTNPK